MLNLYFGFIFIFMFISVFIVVMGISFEGGKFKLMFSYFGNSMGLMFVLGLYLFVFDFLLVLFMNFWYLGGIGMVKFEMEK